MINAINHFASKYAIYLKKNIKFSEKKYFLHRWKHAVTEALKNPKRRVVRVFLTEDSKRKYIKKINI